MLGDRRLDIPWPQAPFDIMLLRDRSRTRCLLGVTDDQVHRLNFAELADLEHDRIAAITGIALTLLLQPLSFSYASNESCQQHCHPRQRRDANLQGQSRVLHEGAC